MFCSDYNLLFRAKGIYSEQTAEYIYIFRAHSLNNFWYSEYIYKYLRINVLFRAIVRINNNLYSEDETSE